MLVVFVCLGVSSTEAMGDTGQSGAGGEADAAQEHTPPMHKSQTVARIQKLFRDNVVAITRVEDSSGVPAGAADDIVRILGTLTLTHRKHESNPITLRACHASMACARDSAQQPRAGRGQRVARVLARRAVLTDA